MPTVVHESRQSKRKIRECVPGLLLAFRAFDAKNAGEMQDRAAVGSELKVGRSSRCGLVVSDQALSQEHFQVTQRDDTFVVEDLGSTNGTWLNGRRLIAGGGGVLSPVSIIRAGNCVFVFHADASSLLNPGVSGEGSPHKIAGRFYVGPLQRSLMEASLSRRYPLLAGPSGGGKDLAARILASLWGLKEPRRYNVASASTPEEMSRTLFGVAPKTFTGVEAKDGLIVTAAKMGSPLFLDEVHNLPAEAQATLLTVIEDGKFSRKGSEGQEITVDLRFIFASNEPDKLRHDLKARLWKIDIPSLQERVADVPDILAFFLERHMKRYGVPREALVSAMDCECFHDVCLAASEGRAFAQSNVRGLEDLADRIVSRVAAGTSADEAVDTVFSDFFARFDVAGEDATGSYDRYRDLISAVYLGCGKNAKRTVELLKDARVPWSISRRHLTKHVEQWGLKD